MRSNLNILNMALIAILFVAAVSVSANVQGAGSTARATQGDTVTTP